jgi:hypothetical protein
MRKKVLRSVGAAFAAVFVVVALSIATDVALYATGVYPPLGQPLDDARCLLVTAYRTLYGVLGGYIVARLAPDRPMRHAMAIGTLGLVVSLGGVVATWGRDLGPLWYCLALVALALPQSWAGAQLRMRQERGARS